MKNKLLKTIALLGIGLGLHENALAQTLPNNTSPASAILNGTNSNQFWSRAGNTSILGQNNIFGTATGFNSPIYTQTNGAFREKLNGDFTGATQYSINTYTAANGVNTSGYLLLGENNNIQPSGGTGQIYQQKGAFSLLHLNGAQNSTPGLGFTQEYGYRPWMKTGITFTGNNDLMYLGIRALAPGQDQSEMLVSWSDNSSPAGNGPDDFVFRFIGLGAGTTVSTDLNSEDDLDGRHIARFAPTGEMGLGSTFGNTASSPIYVRPQSLLHLSLEQNRQVFMQITNQTGTGQGINDGLKVGYAPTSAVNLEARINQQENDRLSLYSNNGERIRITQIGALNNGVAFNPGALAANRTRIAISHDPTTPIQRPLSLLHLGYDVQGATNDGWRPWMDIGMFVSNQSDNVYIGLKQEPGTITGFDRQDAILAWGDNQTSGLPPGNGPDNFRFIFTSTTTPTGLGTPPATGANGLEGGRMTPTLTQGVFTGFGGDPSANLYFGGAANPTNTLEVNSWGAVTTPGGSSGLRFTDLNATSPTIANPGQGVLSVDSTGKIIYTTGGNIVGNYCGLAPNVLTADYRIPLTNFNYYFAGQSTNPTKSRVAVGVPCGTTIQFAKFYVKQMVPNNGLSYAGQFADSAAGDNNYGVYALASQAHYGYGVAGLARQNSTRNVGVLGEAGGHPVDRAGLFIGQLETTASALITSDQMFKTNVAGIKDALSILKKIQPRTYKMDVAGYPQFNFDDVPQIGFIAQEVETVLPQLVHQSESPAEYDETGAVITPAISYKSLNYTGFIPLAVQAINELGSKVDQSTLSDVSIKTNVQNLTGSLAKVAQMRGVTYDWTPAAQTNLGLDSLQHIGFIAQEIHAIDPLLTFTDSSNLMHVNYDRVVPLLVESIKDLNTQVQQKDSALASLQSQINQILTNMENCCNSNHALQSSTQNNSNNNIIGTDVTLKDGQSIVLDQNTPNPFAEQTVIKYYLPDNVSKAQMLFYNAQGKLIQSTELTERGQGQLNVFGSDLSNGIYTYTLVVDNKVIETKKMVKQQ